jgi:hypothetical protein
LAGTVEPDEVGVAERFGTIEPGEPVRARALDATDSVRSVGAPLQATTKRNNPLQVTMGRFMARILPVPL